MEVKHICQAAEFLALVPKFYELTKNSVAVRENLSFETVLAPSGKMLSKIQKFLFSGLCGTRALRKHDVCPFEYDVGALVSVDNAKTVKY